LYFYLFQNWNYFFIHPIGKTFSEYFILSPVDWTKIKGSVMIISMKIISVSFDQQTDPAENISLLEYFGYVFNPASVIFGPFITLKNYRQIFMAPKIVSLLFN